MQEFDTVDLFAGPGGWSVAASLLGLREIGIEYDAAACQTRHANHHATIEGDVTTYGPADFPRANGLIASPPCPTFSQAGDGSGRRELTAVLAGINALASGAPLTHSWEDERTGLTLEPMRWVIEAMRLGRPFRWVSLEQVPTVLPVWQAMAHHLRSMGYGVDVGNLQAEQYGVPQTRKRAVLVARWNGAVQLPEPTHSKFHTRNRSRLDPDVLPWVSMADALGWGGATMRSNYGSGGDPAARGERPSEEPAPTVTSKVDRNKWIYERPSPTIVGSFRPEIVAAPGWRKAGDGPRQNTPGSVRVTVEEAATLQSFPTNYTWCGSKTKQYQQVGNAIPPRLAYAILQSLLTGSE